eukprot:3249801-Ditylum_brightwellii.AAC.1
MDCQTSINYLKAGAVGIVDNNIIGGGVFELGAGCGLVGLTALHCFINSMSYNNNSSNNSNNNMSKNNMISVIQEEHSF